MTTEDNDFLEEHKEELKELEKSVVKDLKPSTSSRRIYFRTYQNSKKFPDKKAHHEYKMSMAQLTAIYKLIELRK